MTYTPLDGRTKAVTLTRWRRVILLALLYEDEGIEELKLSALSQTRVWTANGFIDWLETAGWLARYRHNEVIEVRLTAQGRASALRVLRLLE
jgi:hypothetical protein